MSAVKQITINLWADESEILDKILNEVIASNSDYLGYNVDNDVEDQNRIAKGILTQLAEFES